jgi:hypothetical protein
VPLSIDLTIAIISAILASGSITPFVLVIDKAVIEAAAGT